MGCRQIWLHVISYVYNNDTLGIVYVIFNWYDYVFIYPDSKVHGANMGPTRVLSAPDGPLVGPMNLAIRVYMSVEPIRDIRDIGSQVTQKHDHPLTYLSRKYSLSEVCSSFGQGIQRSLKAKNKWLSKAFSNCHNWLFSQFHKINLILCGQKRV